MQSPEGSGGRVSRQHDGRESAGPNRAPPSIDRASAFFSVCSGGQQRFCARRINREAIGFSATAGLNAVTFGGALAQVTAATTSRQDTAAVK